ncbi:MAG: hypothetical protein HY650_15735 [Acidobacteria bacterium]|nr:hypothetical protein [Acidobacteriota bacterium]
MKIQGLSFLIVVLVLSPVFGAPGVSIQPEHFKSAGRWTSFTNANIVRGLVLQGNALWAGTTGGVVRWDLVSGNYTKYLSPDGLPDNLVTAATTDKYGRPWFGFGSWNGGLAVRDGEQWSVFSPEDGLVTGWVLSLAIDEQDYKWIGTVRGLNVVRDQATLQDKSDDTWGTFDIGALLTTDYVTAIAVDRTGVKWIGTPEGLCVLEDGGTPFNAGDDAWSTFIAADGLPGNSITAIAIDAAGNKWIATNTGGLSVLDDGGTPHNKSDDRWTTFGATDGLVDETVYAIALDSSGRKWLGTGGGVSLLEDNGTPFDKGDDRWTTLKPGGALRSNHVWAISTGAGTEVWFGCQWGVSRLDHGGAPGDKQNHSWRTFITEDGLPHNDITSVRAEGSSLIWVGTASGLAAFDGNRWATVIPGSVNAISIDPTGNKWIATWGVHALNDAGTPFDPGDDTRTEFHQTDGLVDEGVESIALDGAGRKWICTYGGVSLLDDKGTPHNKADDAWTSFTAADGMASDWVHAVAVDEPNRVWFAHENFGVSMLDHRGTPQNKSDDLWIRLTKEDGLAGESVYSILVDKYGRKWFGACGGVSVLDDRGTPLEKSDDVFTTFPVGDCNQGMAFDPQGRLWIATGWSGVIVIDHRGTPFNVMDDIVMAYTSREGLVDNRTQAIAVSSSGRVWVGTDGGLGCLDP